MYCPRCGSPNNDTTKFCRQCGLGLQQVTGYVASGGTAQLPHPQPDSPKLPNLAAKATEGMTPKQKLVLTILLIAMSPAIFGTLGLGWLSGLSAVLSPIAIVFAVMRYKAQKRMLQQAMMQAPLYPQMPHQAMPPASPYGLPHPTQQPIPQPIPQHSWQPVYQPPVVPSPPPTNPLKGPGSVVEDETRRF